MIIWQDPDINLQLTEDRVHIWRANLDLPSAQIDRLASFLSPDEITRANRFRFPQHRTSFIASRGILRQLLGNYLNLHPQDIEFDYSDRGKPLLAKSNIDISLQFNLSHSREYALFGFAIDRLIGVDLEYLREMRDAVKIARRFFSSKEYSLIASLDLPQQQQTFFKLWTAKEAYLKAIGIGLAGSLADVEITLDSSKNASILISKTQNWSMYPCIPASDYVGAIAISKSIPLQQIDFWSWHQNLLNSFRNFS